MALSPLGKVPVLVTEEGAPLFESNAIARYLARLDPGSLLFGSTPLEAGQVEQWIDFTSNEVDAPLVSWVLPLLGPGFPFDSGKQTAAMNSVRKSLSVLDAVLLRQTYLVGDAVTLADIIACCNLYLGFKHVFDEDFRRVRGEANVPLGRPVDVRYIGEQSLKPMITT